MKLGAGARKSHTDRDFFWVEGGSYPVMNGSEYSFHGTGPQHRAPAEFGLTVVTTSAASEWEGDGVQTAWIGLLDRTSDHQQVSLTVLHAKTEPTSTLESLRAAYTHKASGVITKRENDRLEAISDRHFTPLTDFAGRAPATLTLHVFARVASGREEHVLVLLPARSD